MRMLHCDKIEEGLTNENLANNSLTNENPDFSQYLLGNLQKSEIRHCLKGRLCLTMNRIKAWMSFRFRPRHMIVKVSYYFKVDPNRPQNVLVRKFAILLPVVWIHGKFITAVFVSSHIRFIDLGKTVRLIRSRYHLISEYWTGGISSQVTTGG